MAEIVPLDVPDLLEPSPTLNDTFSSTASASPHDPSLLDISASFNVDYLTLKHDAEIAAIRASLPHSSSSSDPPPVPASSSPRGRPQSAHGRDGGGREARGESRRVQLLGAEAALLQDRVHVLERLMRQQSADLEERVASVAQLYVKLSEHQHALADVTHQRDALQRELTALRATTDGAHREAERAQAERERERESSDRHIAALKKELTEVRSRWVEATAGHERLTAEYAQHEEQYSRRLDELERQRQRWEKAEQRLADAQQRMEEVRRENERLKEEAVRVGQLTAEVSGLHGVVERIHVERKAYEDDRAQWAQERREADKRDRDIQDALVTAELVADKARREAEAIKREAEEARQRHQRDVAELEQRRTEERDDAQRRAKLLKADARTLKEDIARLQDANQRLAHPDHEENSALKAQVMALMDVEAQLHRRLHDEELQRLRTEQRLEQQQQRIDHLQAHRHRLIQRVQDKAQQVRIAQSFYAWSAHIQVRRLERRQDGERQRAERERAEREAEERKEEKAAVDRALRELEEKMKRMEDERSRQDDERRKAEARVADHDSNAAEEERRRQRERDDRRRERKAEKDREREQMADREAREREAKGKQQQRQQAAVAEEEESKRRSPTPQRHRHRHYVSPSTSPAAAPMAFAYQPALSALLALTPSTASAEDVRIAARMEALLAKLDKLQRLKAQPTTHSHDDGPRGRGIASPTAHPRASTQPPLKAEVLSLPSSLAAGMGKENHRPLREERGGDKAGERRPAHTSGQPSTAAAPRSSPPASAGNLRVQSSSFRARSSYGVSTELPERQVIRSLEPRPEEAPMHRRTATHRLQRDHK